MTKKTAILIISFLALLLATNAQEPKLVVPVGHSSRINSANLSSDGKYIVSAGRDETVKIWEVASGKLIHTLRGANINSLRMVITGWRLKAIFASDNKYVVATSYSNIYVWEVITEKLLYIIDNINWITNFSISSEQKKIITSGWDGTIKTWDFSDGKLINTFKNKSMQSGEALSFVNFSSNQNYFITANVNDTVARIWDMSTGNIVDSLKGLNKVDENFTATFSPDSKIIITKCPKFPAQIWDAATGKLLYTKNYDAFVVTRGAGINDMYPLFSSDGKYIISTDVQYTFSTDGKLRGFKTVKGHVKVFNAATGELLFDLGEHYSLAKISPDNKYIITGSFDGTIKLWQLSTGKLIYILNNEPTDGVTSISFSDDGKYCVTSSWDNLIKIWNISTGKLAKNSGGDIHNIWGGRFVSNSKNIVYSNGFGIKNWEVTTGKWSKIFGPKEGAQEVFPSPQGKYVTYYENDTAKIWDVATGKILFNEADIDNYNVCYFSPNEKYLLTSSDSTNLKIWDLSNGKLVNTVVFENNYNILFNPDNISFISFSSSTSNPGKIKVWETSTGNLLRTIQGGENENILCFSPNGEHLVTSSKNDHRTSRILDLNTGKIVHTLNMYAIAACYSPDGKYLSVCASDTSETVRIFSATTGQLINTLFGRNFLSRYSSDGKYIITYGFSNGVVKIWEASSYVLLHTLDGWNGDVGISPDGKYIRTSSEEGIKRIWNLNSGTLLYSLVINDDDYLVFDKDFRFDGTPAARDLLYYVCGNEVVNLEQFKNLCWEPGLVSKIMGVNKEPITAKGLSEINICNYTPKVEEKGYGNGKYNFEITPRTGGIGEILLFVNNKQIKTCSPAKLLKKDGAFQLEVNEKEIREYLVSGAENNVEVVALTADKEMKSQRSVIAVNEKLNKNAPVRMYAISVGISRYKDDKLKLTYASKDAEDFSGVLNKAAKKFLDIDSSQHVFTYTFSTGSIANWPSKENIKKAFEEVAKKATADDILVLFLAGHGTLKSMDKKFYFLTQEASSFGFAGVEKEVAISTDELNEWMSNIKAQKQILVLDACSSGEVVTDMQQLITKREIPADQLRALEKLKDRTGTYILSASASGQAAYESKLYEQGLLTYSLLSGLKFGRGLKDNKFIDVSKWFNAAADEVKVLAKDIGGRQDPQIIGSASFDIGIVDRSISDSIKLTSKKKIFKRSRFIGNTTLLNDDLELSSLVDKELNELSAKGIESPIVFADDDSYADNYSLRGSYTVTNNQVRVTVTLFKGQKERLHQFEVRGKPGEKDKIVEMIINKAKDLIEK